MDDGFPAVRIIVFILLLIIDAAVSGMNVAVMSMSENELEKRAEGGDKHAGKLLVYVREPISLLRTVDMVVNACALVAGAFVVAPLCRRASLALMDCTGLGYTAAAIAGYALVCVLAILLIYIAGVLLPKQFAFKYSEKWAYTFLTMIHIFEVICRPFAAAAMAVSNLILKLFGINPKDFEESVTEEEIITLVSEGQEQGVIEDSEAEMINNILEFDDKAAGDIMTHRRHVIGIDGELYVEEAARIIADSHFSRFPVYEEDMDNIVGMIFLKDILRHYVNDRTEMRISQIMRKPFFVPDTKQIDELFKEMQATKQHMAVVVDEYGQSCGIVTLEDVLEEIVGNIFDEYDLEDHNIQSIGSNYIVNGLTPLDELGDELGIEFGDDFDVLNGFMISSLQKIPQSGDNDFVDYEGYRFKVISVKDSTISLVKVSKITG